MNNGLFSSGLNRGHLGRLAIVAGGNRCTYEEFFHGIDGLCRSLREMGVGKGSRVGLWGYNCANWLIAFFAIVKAGGTAVLLNYSMGIQDAADLLSMTETSFLLCGDNGETKKDAEAMKKLSALAGIPENHFMDIRPSVLDLSKVFQDSPDEEDVRTEEEAYDTAFIIFTSGTTSQPKAVQVSQQALSFDARSFNKNIYLYG